METIGRVSEDLIWVEHERCFFVRENGKPAGRRINSS